MVKKTLDWIKEVREGCKKVLEEDAEKVLKIIEKGKFEAKALEGLLEEIKEQERDDAILSLIQAMLEEEIVEVAKNEPLVETHGKCHKCKSTLHYSEGRHRWLCKKCMDWRDEDHINSQNRAKTNQVEKK